VPNFKLVNNKIKMQCFDHFASINRTAKSAILSANPPLSYEGMKFILVHYLETSSADGFAQS